MQKLTQRARLYITSSLLAAGAFLLLYLLPLADSKFSAAIFLAASLLLALLYARTRRVIACARLIRENSILHIRPAVTCALFTDCKSEPLPGGSMEIYVSCFGLLLESEVIIFNQERICLKAVELGRGYIELTYGPEGKELCTRLLYAAINEEELASVAQRFYFETGVSARIEQ